MEMETEETLEMVDEKLETAGPDEMETGPEKMETENLMGTGADERKEMARERSLVGHPSLLAWSPPRVHRFSKAELESLTAICDTVIPSLPPPEGNRDEDVARFYKATPSDEDVIDVVAAALGFLARPVKLRTLLAVMRLLSTGLGTFLLGSVGGVSTFTLRYPFLRRFSSLAPAERERVLQGWSGSSIAAIRQMFKALKSITAWAFYSKLDERGENVAWRAIRYAGAAPEARSRTQEDFNAQRPLGGGHIDAKAAGAKLKPWLASKGFSVVEDIESFRLGDGECHDGDVHLECDVVIVGSGSGGGVMAAALAAQGFKVVVLEKGEYFATQDFSTLEGPAMVNLLEKMGCLATDDGGVALIAGKTVGGGTAINWSVSFKTPENVRGEWAKDHGLELFQSPRYEAALDAVWERLAVQPDVARHNLQNAVLQDGCAKLNLPCGTLARNAPPDHFCGWCSYGCPSGKKQSTAQTWLVDAVNTGNAVILSNCNADRVFHSPSSKKPRRAHGVAATIGPHRIFVKANATVVSCGALMTPVLLLRSGFSNPNIGKFLRLHPASTTYGYFPEGIGPEGRAYEGGIMTAYSPVTLRKPAEYGGLLETGVFHPSVFAAFHAWRSGADGKARLLRHGRTSHITVVTRDKGSGSVKIDREGDPVFKYSISAYDEETLVAGLVQSLMVFIAAGAVEVGTQQLDGERFVVKGASNSDIEAYLARVKRRGAKESSIQLASAHQLGSCRMGTNPASSAVDPKGEMWEAEGLFVGDGSVLPTSSGVNPMITIQSIAYCTADSVAQYLRKFQV